jgi:hypothetical protein
MGVDESIDELRAQLYELMGDETMWSCGKVLSLSQELDKLIIYYHLSMKSE